MSSTIRVTALQRDQAQTGRNVAPAAPGPVPLGRNITVKISERPDLTVTVVSWNTRDLVRACLRSIKTGAFRARIEVHIVDNASTDGTVEMVQEEFPDVRLFANSQNVGFARANNQSWRESQARYWMLLNADAEVRPLALDNLVGFMDKHPKTGLATARLVNADGTPQYCAQPIPSISRKALEATRLHKLLSASVRNSLLLSTYWTYDRAIRVGWTWGTALVARREAVEHVGPLSDKFFMYGEDLEWCLRMRRQNWEVWFCPDAEVLHHGGQSSMQQWSEIRLGYRLWDGFYQALLLHRSWISVRALQVITLASSCVEWLASRIRGRTVTSQLATSIRYHCEALMGKMLKQQSSRTL